MRLFPLTLLFPSHTGSMVFLFRSKLCFCLLSYIREREHTAVAMGWVGVCERLFSLTLPSMFLEVYRSFQKLERNLLSARRHVVRQYK